MKSACIYGAGNIGRGFIGQIFGEAGYSLTFIDVAVELIDIINHEKRYPVRLLNGDSFEDHWIENVYAVNSRNMEQAAECIAHADIMATAVGVRVLPHIAPVIAAGLKKRFALQCEPLDIIICENILDANKLLKKLIKAELKETEQRLFDEGVGLVEASIGRMVPIQTATMQDGNVLRISTESYAYIPVDLDAFKGRAPDIPGIVPYKGFDFFIKRKLFIHNMGHAITAYLGLFTGDEYIYQAITRHDIRYMAENAMLESAIALSNAYSMSLADIVFHIKDLLHRFSNKALGDTCARVGSDTIRKLGYDDRLIGAMRCCIKQNITPAFIAIGAAAALHCHLDENNIKHSVDNAAAKLAELSGLSCNADECALILSMYSLLLEGASGAALINAAEKAGLKQGIL
jgi:mannitol-1-phosphate 5-dehydrogenase